MADQQGKPQQDLPLMDRVVVGELLHGSKRGSVWGVDVTMAT